MTLRRVFTGLIALSLAPTFAWAGLTHRYSFSEKGSGMTAAKDSVGNVDGKLQGGAAITDGKLVLKNDESATSGTDKVQYLEFASSLLSKTPASASFVFWFTAKDV